MNPTDAPVLRDIHLPPSPSWWPPAPGWWVLAAVLLVLAAFAIRTLLRAHRARAWRRNVVAELDRIAAAHRAEPDAARLAAAISNLLRRATRLLDRDAAALPGERWLAFLDARIGDTAFATGAGRALLDAPYRREADVDAPALVALARRWLDRALVDRALVDRALVDRALVDRARLGRADV